MANRLVTARIYESSCEGGWWYRGTVLARLRVTSLIIIGRVARARSLPSPLPRFERSLRYGGGRNTILKKKPYPYAGLLATLIAPSTGPGRCDHHTTPRHAVALAASGQVDGTGPTVALFFGRSMPHFSVHRHFAPASRSSGRHVSPWFSERHRTLSVGATSRGRYLPVCYCYY